MKLYCKDIDLLKFEPSVFMTGSFESQLLYKGKNAQFKNGNLLMPDNSVVQYTIKPGMVVHVYKKNPYEGTAYEIIQCLSNKEMKISVLRTDADGNTFSPKNETGLNFRIVTFASKIKAISEIITNKLKHFYEVSNQSFQLPESEQLKNCTAAGTLGQIFLSRTVDTKSEDPNWQKAQHYNNLFKEKLAQLRIPSDSNGDGLSDSSRSTANVTLRRV